MEFDGTVASATPAAAPATPTPSPEPATPAPSAAPTATPTPAPSAAPTTPPVEPSWLKGRLEETRAAAIRQAQTEYAQREQQMRQQYEAVQRQLHAIVGVTPQEDPEIAAVKAQFNRLFPGLSKLESIADQIAALQERSGDLEQQSQHYWTSYGRQTMDRLYAKAEQSLGGPLSKDGKEALLAAFSGYVASSPTLTERYSKDPTIVDEYWDRFASNLIDPVRRQAAATVEQQTGPLRQALPQDTAPGAPVLQSQQPQFKSLDERAAAAWAGYNTGRK